MRFSCPKCRASYDVSESLLRKNRGKFKCTKCGLIFEVELGFAQKGEEASQGEKPLLHRIPSDLYHTYERASDGHVPSMLQLISELGARGEAELALELFEKFEEVYKNAPTVLVEVAGIYLEKEEYGKAREYASKALQESPQNLKAKKYLLTALYHLGEGEDARRLLDELLREVPEDEDLKRISQILKGSESEEEDEVISFGDISGEEERSDFEEVSEPLEPSPSEEKIEGSEVGEGEEDISFGEISGEEERGSFEEVSEGSKLPSRQVEEEGLPEELGFSSEMEQPEETGLPEEVEEGLEGSEERAGLPSEEAPLSGELDFSDLEAEGKGAVEQGVAEEAISSEDEEVDFGSLVTDEGAGEQMAQRREKFETAPEKEGYWEEASEEVVEGRENEEEMLSDVEFLSGEEPGGGESPITEGVEVEEITPEGLGDEGEAFGTPEKTEQASEDDELKSLEEELSSILSEGEEEVVQTKEETDTEISFDKFLSETIDEEEEIEEEEGEEFEGKARSRKLILPIILAVFFLLAGGAGFYYYLNFERVGPVEKLTGEKILNLRRGFIPEGASARNRSKSIIKKLEEEVGQSPYIEFDHIYSSLKESAAFSPHDWRPVALFLMASLVHSESGSGGVSLWETDLFRTLQGEIPSYLEELIKVMIHTASQGSLSSEQLSSLSWDKLSPLQLTLFLMELEKLGLYSQIVTLYDSYLHSLHLNPMANFIIGRSMLSLNNYSRAEHFLTGLIKRGGNDVAFRILLANLYSNIGRESDALRVLPSEKEVPPSLTGLFRLTQMLIYARTGQVEEAVKVGKVILASERVDPQVRLEIGRAFALAGRIGEAQQALNPLLKDQRFRGQALKILADVLFESGKYSEAVGYLGSLYSESSDVTVGGKYAYALLKAGKLNMATKIAESVLSRDPTNFMAGLVKAWVFSESSEEKELKEAFTIASSLSARKPDHPEVKLIEAKIAFKRGNKSESARYANQAMELAVRSGNWQLLREIYTVLSLSGDTGGAITAIENYLKMAEKPSWKEYVDLANLYLKRGEVAECLRVLTSGEKLFEGNPAFLTHAGEILLKAHRPSQALKYLEKAVRLNPSNVDANYMLGELYLHQKNTSEAVQFFQKTVVLKPDHHRAYFQLGKIYYHSKNMDRALYYSKKAYQLNPEDQKYLSLYANILIDTGRISEADDLIKGAIRKFPSQYKFYLLSARVQFMAGNFSEAKKILFEGIKNAGERSEFYTYLAKVYFYMGDLTEAKRAVKKAMVLGPVAETYYIRGKLAQEEGDFDTALNMFEMAIKAKKNYAEAYYWEGKLLKRLSKWSKAKKYLTEALKIGLPSDLEADAKRELMNIRMP